MKFCEIYCSGGKISLFGSVLVKCICLYVLRFHCICIIVGFGGLGVACWLLVPKFVGSNLAEAVGFFRAKKSSARLPSERK